LHSRALTVMLDRYISWEMQDYCSQVHGSFHAMRVTANPRAC
jgi:hypothetical protein